MKRASVVLAGILAVAVGAFAQVAPSGAAHSKQACTRLRNLYTASKLQLEACGLTEAPLSSTSRLTGGGRAYSYKLPNGQTTSVIQPPAGFNPRSASAAEDKAYGVPPEPSHGSPGYATWRALTDGNYARVHARPYLVVGDRPLTEPQSSSSIPVEYDNYGGYQQNIVGGTSGWHYAAVQYNEPTLGVTHCSGPAVAFWAGIGGTSDLGQTGTASGPEGLHQVFIQNVGAGGNPVYEGVTVPKGTKVIANVQYNGSSNWSYTDTVGGTTYDYAGTGPYQGGTAFAVVEDPLSYPLLNFESITMHATVGQNGADMNPSLKDVLPDQATTGAISGGTFTVTHTNCN